MLLPLASGSSKNSMLKFEPDKYGPRPHRRRRPSGSCVRERWPSRLVATAATEDGLNRRKFCACLTLHANDSVQPGVCHHVMIGHNKPASNNDYVGIGRRILPKPLQILG